MLRFLPKPPSTRGINGINIQRLSHSMNRPRNRQARPPRNRQTQHASSNVPSTSQVQAGARVAIVLKADQSSGREVQGVVQDLLTRGDHPRGMKVRLRDGRIGRVQRMVAAPEGVSSTLPLQQQAGASRQVSERAQSGDEDGPPAQTSAALSDYFNGEVLGASPTDHAVFTSATAKCPVCGDFEGDEAAVAHHVQEHFDQNVQSPHSKNI